ncbi:uncharacterized protein LOC144644605 [Oculina patagonica]
MDMEGEFEMNGTMMMSPTNISDPSNDKEETVEVGVIIMGLCCICLVACALVVLQLRSNNRRISGNRHRSGPPGDVSGDRSRDPLDVGAPPSYDAVIRSPHLYPPSRRNSVTLDVSETRRSSGSSTFSLSLHSPRLVHHFRVVPRGTSEDNLSQYSDMQLRGSNEEDNEEPPPPYPGNVELTTSRNARSTDYMWHSNLRPTRQNNRAREDDSAGENGPLPPDGRGSGEQSSQGHHVVVPCGTRVVNAWIDNEHEHPISRDETSHEPCRTNSCQSDSERRNLDVNQRDLNLSRTFVTHSSRGPGGTVSITRTFPSENAELTETV